MLPIDLEVIRLTLHVLGAIVWVGSQIVLAALVGPLRRVAPEAVAPAARVFARVGWPAYGLLILTGFWMLSGGGGGGDAYKTTLLVKLALVVLSGLGAALYTFAKNPALKNLWGAVGLLSALGAVLLGVSIVEAG